MLEKNHTTNNKTVLAIVIPCYNEEIILLESAKELIRYLEQLIEAKLISSDSFVFFVDDGSNDNTWNIIKSLSDSNKHVRGHKLSKNYGHQMALLSGLLESSKNSDVVVSLDADLQHDISAIEKMLYKIQEGIHIVYGIRNKRNSHSKLKDKISHAFYKVMKMIGVELISNHADFRMCTKQVLHELKKHDEVHVFLRGLFPLMGFKSDIVYFDEKERKGGTSKYSFKKMMNLAVSGITSFSTVPLKLILWIGFVIFLLSVILIINAIWQWSNGNTVPGWASILIVTSFMGGIQLLSIGIIGEYLGKIYQQTKKRPRFIIEKKTNESN